MTMKYFRRLYTAVAGILLLLAVAGCSEDNNDNPTGPGTNSSTLAVIQTSGDDENNIAVIDYMTGTADIDLLPVGGTCNLTQFGDLVYIVDKEYDRVVAFDPEARQAVGELSTNTDVTGTGTAPNTIVFVSATKAFVTLSDVPYVLIINPSTMTVTGTIDISAMADGDGDPDQYHAVLADGKLYVALRRSTGRSLNDHSSLAVIDAVADTVITEHILTTNGIAGASRHSIGGQVIGTDEVTGPIYPYIIGSVSNATDGAIEQYDPATGTSSVIYTEDQIGGSILFWVFDSPTSAYAISGLSTTSGGTGWGLTRFDLAAGTFTSVSQFQGSAYSWALDCTDNGLVLVGSKDEDEYGVWVFDANDGYAPVFDEPIDVGLLPQRILVVR